MKPDSIVASKRFRPARPAGPFVTLLALLVGAFLPARSSAQIVTSTSTVPRTDSVAAGTRPVSLAEAVRAAQANSPQTVSATSTVRSNQAAVRAAYGAFLPSMTANLGGVRQFTGQGSITRVNSQGETVQITGDHFTFSNSLSFQAQLFSFDRIPNLRAAQADVRSAQQNVEVQSLNVALNVEQQFFSAIAARESEDAARAQLAQALQQLDAARRRVIAGAATASDSLTAVVQVANAQLAVLNAEVTRRDANAALTRLAGSSVPLSASLNDPAVTALDTVRVDSAAVVNRAVAGPSVSQATAAVSAARARQTAARSTYFPTLNASYSRGGSGTGFGSPFGFGDGTFPYTGQFSFAVSIPIFNQFTREANVARANATAATATATERDTRLAAEQSAVQYLDALRLGQEQIAVQTASIAAAQENLRVQTQRYGLGLATIVDVLTAQTTLNQARANLITARNIARLATAQIQALIGQPLSTVTIGAVR